MVLLNLDQAKRDAEKYVIVSKRTTNTDKVVNVSSTQEVKTSQTQKSSMLQTPRKPSPKETLTAYLKSIGMQ